MLIILFTCTFNIILVLSSYFVNKKGKLISSVDESLESALADGAADGFEKLVIAVLC